MMFMSAVQSVQHKNTVMSAATVSAPSILINLDLENISILHIYMCTVATFQNVVLYYESLVIYFNINRFCGGSSPLRCYEEPSELFKIVFPFLS